MVVVGIQVGCRGFAFVGLLRNPRKAMPWLAVAVIGIIFAYGTYWTVGGEEVQNANGIDW